MAEVNTEIYKDLMKDVNPLEQTNNLLNTVAKAQQVKQQAIGIDSAKFELAMKNVGAVNQTISGLLGDPDVGKTDISKKIIDATTRLVKDNVYTAQHVTEALKSMPTDPVRQAQWLRNIYSQTQGAEQRAQSFFGSPQGISDQSGTNIVQIPGMPNLPPSQRGRINNQLPPTTPAVQGDPTQPNYGAGGYVGPSGPPGLQPPPGFPSAPAARPGMMPATPEAPARAMVPSTPKVVGDREAVASGLYEGATPAQRVAGGFEAARPMSSLPPDVSAARAGAVQSYTDTMAAAGKFAQRINPLRQAIPLLEKMKETDIGPTSERWNDIKSTAQTLGAGRIIGGIDPEKIRDYNELKKYFNQYTAQAAATMGPKTNEGLATAVTSNPNVNMDKLSATDLSKIALGVERMQQAGALEFNEMVQSGRAQPGDFNRFMLKWGTEQDPRAFVYDIMDRKAQEKVKKLPASERAKVAEGMRIAEKHKLLGDVHRE